MVGVCGKVGGLFWVVCMPETVVVSVTEAVVPGDAGCLYPVASVIVRPVVRCLLVIVCVWPGLPGEAREPPPLIALC